MLLTVKGMSAEKVAFVTAPEMGYPTPRALYEAFKRDERREMRERREREVGASVNGAGTKRGRIKKIRPARELLCELGGSGRGKVGPVLSGHIYDLLMGNY
jgi:hypothetical protein